MKKLSKINISAEKVLGNEELVNLRGGDYGNGCYYIQCMTFQGELLGDYCMPYLNWRYECEMLHPYTDYINMSPNCNC